MGHVPCQEKNLHNELSSELNHIKWLVIQYILRLIYLRISQDFLFVIKLLHCVDINDLVLIGDKELCVLSHGFQSCLNCFSSVGMSFTCDHVCLHLFASNRACFHSFVFETVSKVDIMALNILKSYSAIKLFKLCISAKETLNSECRKIQIYRKAVFRNQSLKSQHSVLLG